MVTKVDAPSESDAQKAARERAEEQARDAQIGEIRRGVTTETASILRRFGLVTGGANTGPTKATAAQQAFAGFGAINTSSRNATFSPSGGSGSSTGFSQFAR